MPPPGLCACVIAKNEADRIDECLVSLAFCDEILVVDAHSSDATREIAAARGARVIERDWPGHAAQKEFAIRAARHDWVLCVDADERDLPRARDRDPAPARRRLSRRARLAAAAPVLLSRALDPPRHLVPRSAAPSLRSSPRALGGARPARPRRARRQGRRAARAPAPPPLSRPRGSPRDDRPLHHDDGERARRGGAPRPARRPRLAASRALLALVSAASWLSRRLARPAARFVRGPLRASQVRKVVAAHAAPGVVCVRAPYTSEAASR